MSETQNAAVKDRNITKELVAIAVPLVFSNLAYTLLGVIDTLIMGRVSVTAVASVGLASIAYITVILLPRGAVGGCVTFVSRMFGAGDKDKAGLYTRQFIFLALILSPIAFLMPMAFKAYFNIVKPAPDVVASAVSYLNIRVFEVPFALVNMVISSFLAGIGNTRLSMTLAWFGVGINIVANWILVFGLLGLPALGVPGSALGTVIAVISQTILSIVVVRRAYGKEYSLGWPKMPDADTLWRMLRISGPMGIMDFIELAAWTTFLSLIGRLGTVELAASQIAQQISSLAFMPGLALGTAACSLVSRYIGASDIRSAEKVAYKGAGITMGFMGVLSLVFFTVPGYLARVFTPETNVISLCTTLLRILAFYQIFDAMNIVFRGALNGGGDTRFSMTVVILGSWLILVPMVYVTAFILEWGVIGPWISATFYIVMMGIILALRFRKGYWKRISL